MRKIILAIIAALILINAGGVLGEAAFTPDDVTAREDCFFANGVPITIDSPTADKGNRECASLILAYTDCFSGEKDAFPNGSLIYWGDDDGGYVYASGTVSVYGGSYKEKIDKSASITMNGGFVKAIWGSAMSAGEDAVKSTNIVINAGTTYCVYGSGNESGVSGDVNIVVHEKAELSECIGGGREEIYSDMHSNVGGRVKIEVNGAKISTRVLGGGYGSTVGGSEIIINGGMISGIYAGGYTGDILGDSSITINDASMIGSVYGGGYSGSLLKNTSITMRGGNVELIFGGGCTPDSVVEGNVDIEITGGRIKYGVCGDAFGSYGTVGGTKTLRISGNPSIYNKEYASGLELNTFTDAKVYITGELTGDDASICLTGGAKPLADGVIVATALDESYADADKFYMAGKSLVTRGLNIITATFPTISGQSEMSLIYGYDAVSTDAFVITGTPQPDIAIESDDERISWNEETRRIDIAPGIEPGVYKLTISATSQDITVKHVFTLTVTRFAIALSPSADKQFDAADLGYGEQSAHVVTVTNTGLDATGDMFITFEGESADCFKALEERVNGIEPGQSATFSVAPKTGLSEGMYKAQVKCGNANTSYKSFSVSFTVRPTIKIDSDPLDVNVQRGDAGYELHVKASVSNAGEPEYRWYVCYGKDKDYSNVIGMGKDFLIPKDLRTGEHYYFCRVSYIGAISVDSRIATVVVTGPDPVAIIDKGGETTSYKTLPDALSSVKSGQTVKLMDDITYKGDFTIPSGVSFDLDQYFINCGVITVSDGAQLLVERNQKLSIGGKASTKPGSEIISRFDGARIDGSLSNNGDVEINDCVISGNGMFYQRFGTLTLKGKSRIGNVFISTGEYIEIDSSFKADGVTGVIYLDEYGYMNKSRIIAYESQSDAANFKLGNAPDDAWRLRDDGILTNVVPVKPSIMLDRLVVAQGVKVDAINVLPFDFSGQVNWSTENSEVLAVTRKKKSAFQFSAIKAGDTTLTAIYEDDSTQTIPVKVVAKNEAVSKIKAPSKLKLSVGSSKQLNPKVLKSGAIDKTLYWFSSNPNVASVKDGLITGVSAGKCRVAALSTSGKRKVITVTVKAGKNK